MLHMNVGLSVPDDSAPSGPERDTAPQKSIWQSVRPRVKAALTRCGFLKQHPPWRDYAAYALELARKLDCTASDLRARQQCPEVLNPDVAGRICSWYILPFENPHGGGIKTILRLAAHLRRSLGMRQRFLICGQADPDLVRHRIATAFSDLADSEIMIIPDQCDAETAPFSDYSVATHWTTAYFLLRARACGLKFYMVQDFEPLFYPGGSTSAQADLTYRFGFYGIANTPALAEIYEGYGGTATSFLPCIEPDVFYAVEKPVYPSRLRIVFYARPEFPRNGFEIGIVALHQVAQQIGHKVEILCVGADFDSSRLGLAGSVRNLGRLGYRETGDLYRSAHIGLSMMMTPHPSYLPFEMMACGMLVVTNRNLHNSWLLKDRETCLISENSPGFLAGTLIDAVENYGAFEDVRTRGTNMIRAGHLDWEKQMAHVAQYMRDAARFPSNSTRHGAAVAGFEQRFGTSKIRKAAGSVMG